MRKKLADRSSFWLSIIFVVATALIFFLMALTYKHLQKQASSSDWMTHSYDVSLKLLSVYSNLKDAETERRNYLLTGDRNALTKIEHNNKENSRLVKNLKKLMADNPEQISHMDDLEMMLGYHQKLVRESDDQLKLDENGQPLPSSQLLLAGKNVMDSMREQIDLLLNTEKMLIAERKDELLFRQKSTPFYLFFISLFSLGLLIFAFFRINRDVKNQLKINNELLLAVDTSKLAEKIGGYGIWNMHFDSNTLQFSDNLFRLLGYEPHEIGSTFENFNNHLHPEDRKLVETKLAALKKYGVINPFRFRIIRKDGVQRHVQMMGQSLENSSGNAILLGIATDVTQEIEAQLKLEGINWMLTENNRVLSITNKTSLEAEKIGDFGTVQWFPYDDQLHFSQNLYPLFDIPTSEKNQPLQHFLSRIVDQDRQLVEEKIEEIERNRYAEPFTFRIFSGHQAVKWFSADSKFITGEDEESNYMLIILTEVTEYVETEEQLLEQNRILEGNNRELQAFNYVASHDLQEPLRKIETFISRLIDKDGDKFSDSGKQYVERIHLSAGRMRKLINDLLQFSRTTRTEQTFEITNLNDLLHNSLEELHAKIEDLNADVKVDRMPTLKVVPFQIQQMFTNLIGNSLKYSDPDKEVKISVSCSKVNAKENEFLAGRASGNFFRFEFTDNGIGFENKYAERIFELFNRLHGRLEYEGTGIGLAICKKIVENHYGYIQAEGTEGKGATFTVYLPEYLQK